MTENLAGRRHPLAPDRRRPVADGPLRRRRRRRRRRRSADGADAVPLRLRRRRPAVGQQLRPPGRQRRHHRPGLLLRPAARPARPDGRLHVGAARTPRRGLLRRAALRPSSALRLPRSGRRPETRIPRCGQSDLATGRIRGSCRQSQGSCQGSFRQGRRQGSLQSAWPSSRHVQGGQDQSCRRSGRSGGSCSWRGHLFPGS